MSSDNDDGVRGTSSRVLRRSKRLAGSARESSRAEKFYQYEGRRIRRSLERKFSKISKQRTNEPSKRRESSCLFNGESLTSVELHQLFRKFTTDGHFRTNASAYSPPPPVISQTVNDKIQTTKNNGHGSAKISHQRTDSTWQKAGMTTKNAGPNTTMDDSMSVTFANPLPNATGSTLRIATSGSLHAVYTNCSSIGEPLTTGISALNNRANSTKRSAALVPHENIPGIASNTIPLNFSKPAKHELFVRRTNIYNPLKQLNGPENDSTTNTNDLNYPMMNNAHFGYGFNMANVEPADRSNPEKNAYNQTRYVSHQPNVQSTQTRFNETETGRGFQTGDTNSSDLTFPLQNATYYENCNDFWNVAAAAASEIGPNSLASDPSSILFNAGLKSLSENLAGYPPTSLVGYNLTTNSLGNNRTYVIPGNEIAANTNCKLHVPSLTTWNSECTNVIGTKDGCDVAKVMGDVNGIANNKENISIGIEDCDESENMSVYYPPVSSTCSYDDGIIYENYLDPMAKNANNLEHFVVTTTTQHDARNKDTVGKIKTELTLVRDVSNNYPYFNDHSRINSGDSIF